MGAEHSITSGDSAVTTQLKRYTVQAGDTIQQIARRQLGQADQWWVLVRLNRLIYPYIDGTGSSPAPGVLGIGDSLSIPGNATDPAIQQVAAGQGTIGQYAVLLGEDLWLHEQTLATDPGSTDLETAVGLDNLIFALQRRLGTRKGELAYHPEYGSHLEQHIGHPHDPIRQAYIRQEVRQTLLDDPRITSIPSLTVREYADHLAISMTATIIGQNESVPLNLVVQKKVL